MVNLLFSENKYGYQQHYHAWFVRFTAFKTFDTLETSVQTSYFISAKTKILRKIDFLFFYHAFESPLNNLARTGLKKRLWVWFLAL